MQAPSAPEGTNMNRMHAVKTDARPKTVSQTDRFGNPMDPVVGDPRGSKHKG